MRQAISVAVVKDKPVPMSPKDLAWRILCAWGAYSIEPQLDRRIQPSEPHIVCRKCWRPKPPQEFHLARNRDGRSHCCKACHADLYSRPAWERRKAVSAAVREMRTGKCQRCGGRAPLKNMSRRTCPACQADVAQRLAGRLAFKFAHGGKHRAATPEYRRQQREREAAKAGRELGAYVPQSQREHHAAMVQAEAAADRVRKDCFRSLLREFNQISLADPEVAAGEREKHAAIARKRYARHSQEEVARHLAWKSANPERVSEYGMTRQERQREGADGTATPEAIAQLKRETMRCAYCDASLTMKQTDHMIALALGGEHSLRNIVIVCPNCNARKATLSYAEWVDRIDPLHRSRVVAVFQERYGQAAA